VSFHPPAPDGFVIFAWNRNFETGLTDIDEQHKVLVDILNRVAWHCACQDSELSLDEVLEELLSYADYHFRHEESIWNAALGDSVLAQQHHQSHQVFFSHLDRLKRDEGSADEKLRDVFSYLTRWLAFHILDADRRLACVVKFLDAGLPLDQARQQADFELNGSLSGLVNALLDVYGRLSANTIQLMREKLTRQRVEDELHRLQKERLHQALEQQASEYQQQLETLAFTDALTGLWNRNGIIREIRNYLDHHDGPERAAALVAIDLDDFVHLNARIGEELSDRLLGLLARRWRDALPSDSCLARTGGDEFALLLPDATLVEARLEALRLTASQPFKVDEHEITMAFTAGIVPFPDQLLQDADTLLRQANNVLFKAKHEMKGNWMYLEADEQSQSALRQRIIAEIRHALEHDEFRLLYQPKVNIHTGEVIGTEALIRWQHPERGLLSPASFLPAIEHHRLIIQVGEWVLRQALRQMRNWDAEGIRINVGVNIAAFHLQSDGFADSLRAILAEFPEVEPARLDLEVLETAALGELNKAVQTIESCQGLGVTFSLDDFGTGYSSLSYLKRLPINTLKVDREFVSGSNDKSENQSILRGVIGLSREFDKQLIAEGVEAIKQGEILLALGCEHAQGYAVSPPLEAGHIRAWLDDWKPYIEWRAKRT
jgi:hemerythrin-like metal-binding protein/diguanylate cyclase (GGDEF)-like protein